MVTPDLARDQVAQQSSCDAAGLEQEALAWLTLMLSGTATPDDVAAMERWRNSSSERAAALAAAVRLRKLVAAQEPLAQKVFRPSLLERPQTRRLAAGGLMAALAGYAMARPPLGMWPSLAELSADYHTHVGQRQQVALADGVAIDLNTATSIAVRARHRRIELIAGELAADVTLPPSRTFVAVAGPGQVIAQSASFDLRVQGDSVCAVCLAGRVLVAGGGRQAQLQAGQAVVLRGDGPGPSYAVDAGVTAAWRRGQLIFRDAPFDHIVAEINRYRPGHIMILNSQLARRRFNGSFEINDLDKVVADLTRLSNASVTAMPGGLVLLS